MSETQAILDAFRRVVRALRLNSQAVHAQSGLSGAQLFVLQKIAAGEAMSVNEIAARTATDQSSVSVVVAKLVAKKLLVRRRAADDQRKMLHSLSPAGAKLAQRSQTLVQNRLCRGIASLTKEEQTVLSTLLDKVVKGAELASEPASLFFEDEGKRTDD